jgi:hypothetical protein
MPALDHLQLDVSSSLSNRLMDGTIYGIGVMHRYTWEADLATPDPRYHGIFGAKRGWIRFIVPTYLVRVGFFWGLIC